jgi:predicted nuclease of predicted toxin-antitoxin system
MKILIDENLPLKLKNSFGDRHEVSSAREMGWQGKKNGELLGLMTLAGFDTFVTMDKSLPTQQNLEKFAIRIFILRGINNKL